MAESEINYMFKGNLETIKRMIDEMVQMDPMQVDQILSNGHDWAVDHITTSADDIAEVYNFLKTSAAEPMPNNHDHHKHEHQRDMGDFLQSFESFTYKG
jgi:hypothetical protein